MQQNFSIPTTQWIPPTPPPSTSVSSAEDSAGPTSLIPHLTQPLQLLSPSDLSVSHEQQSDDYFLQGLMDLTATTPSQACQLDPGVFDICPELLDPSLCGPPWEDPEQQHAFSTTTAADDIDNTAPAAPPTQQEKAPASPAPEPADPPKQCRCVAALLDHLSTSSSSPPSSAPSLSEAALRTSKALLARCRTILRCANRCASRSSTALVVCEAVDQALGGLGAQPSSKGWPRQQQQQEEESEGAGDEQEVLRCGGVAIRGAERRAAVRALLVKRLLELRGVLEALLQAVRGTAAAGRRAGVERACWRVCAELVAEFAGRVAERVEFVKVHL
ncbi:hypothetical protein GTA08_BOTSDO09478 [Botryosphaeria dothidea]|uniref:Aflatoxin regulatory protein domain-containing protein n=1 Tax=Botryosphaeria dothidea TaxID=55169 RepID=A0A8H4ILC7_9PEZI|nr:hypothetical protein GTA08_BOTSDO09478 [Botryosphaeria dothidea]